MAQRAVCGPCRNEDHDQCLDGEAARERMADARLRDDGLPPAYGCDCAPCWASLSACFFCGDDASDHQPHGATGWGSCVVDGCSCLIHDGREVWWTPPGRARRRLFLCQPPDDDAVREQRLAGPVHVVRWVATLLDTEVAEGPAILVSHLQRDWLESLPDDVGADALRLATKARRMRAL